jgi:hypothetical protein
MNKRIFEILIPELNESHYGHRLNLVKTNVFQKL